MSEQGWMRTILAIAAVLLVSLVTDSAVSNAASLGVPTLPSTTDVTGTVDNTVRTVTAPAPPLPPPVTNTVKKVTSPTTTGSSPTRAVTSPVRTITAPVTKQVTTIVGGTTKQVTTAPSVPGPSSSPGSGTPAGSLLTGDSGGGGPAAGGTGTAPPGAGPGAPPINPLLLLGGPGSATGGHGAGPNGAGGSGGVTAAEVAAFIAGLKSCLMALPSLERDFLIYRAGLDGRGVRSRTASSRALGIAPARGRVVERRALGRLRSAAAGGECGAASGDAFAAGLFVSPTLMSPLGTLLAPVQGIQPVGSKKAAAAPAGYRSRPSLGETLRGLGEGESGPGSLWAVAVIMLFLFGSVAALMRETRRSI